jgi:hypothetical protein
MMRGEHKPWRNPETKIPDEILVEIQFYKYADGADGTLFTDAMRIRTSDRVTALKRALTNAQSMPYSNGVIGARVVQ